MNSRALGLPGRRPVPDPDRLLEAYADATQITASAQLVRRFQARIEEERTSTPRWRAAATAVWARPAWWLHEVLASTFGRGPIPAVLRVQSLALLLLLVLALGAAVGGAGAVVVTVVERAEQAVPLPGQGLLGPTPVPTSPVVPPVRGRAAAPAPTTLPRVRLSRMAQRHPRGHHTGRTPAGERAKQRPRSDGASRAVRDRLLADIGSMGSCPVRCQD